MGRKTVIGMGAIWASALLAVSGASAAIQVDQVEDINPSGNSQPDELFALDDLLLFRADDGTTGVELWKSDGDGAEQVADMNASGGSNPTDFAKLGNVAVFGAYATPEPGSELYKTDGSGPPSLVANINTNPNVGSNPHYMTTLGSTVLFDAVEPSVGHSLHVSDGSGAQILEDSDGNPVDESNPEPLFTKLGGQLIFTAYTAADGNELWRTNGTSAGTEMIKDIQDPGSGAPFGFGKLGNEVFFAASTDDEGTELWKSDGTAGGTRLVKNIADGTADSAPFFGYDFAKLGKNLLFNASDGESGSELWKTNGTAHGTKRVKDIYPGPSSGNPEGMTTLGKQVIFGASDNQHGDQVFASDGTGKGTKALKQVQVQEDFDDKLHRLGDTVFFDGNGELWGTDGTKAGTKLASDINPSDASSPSNFTRVGETLFFSAVGPDGRELYKVTGG